MAGILRGILGIALLAFLLRLSLFLLVPQTGDSVLHYGFIEHIAERGKFPIATEESGYFAYFYPPLLHLLGALAYPLGKGAVLFLPVLYGTIAVVGIYRLGKLLHGERIALMAGAAAAVLPSLLYYSAVNYTDMLLFALSVWSFYFYFAYRKNGGRKELLIACALAGMAALTHYNGLAIPVVLAMHSFFEKRDAKVSFVLLALPLLIASPWYARNYVAYGNPVFPIFDIGRYPDAHYDTPPFLESVPRLANPGHWAGMFLESWVGAPNSNDALGQVGLAAEKAGDVVYAFFAGWLLLIIALTALALYGFLRMDRGLLALSGLLFASGTLLSIQTPYPRMYFPLIPFFVFALAAGADRVEEVFEKTNKKYAKMVFVLVSLAAVAALVSVPFAYAYVYKGVFESSHMPYYGEIAREIPEGSLILAAAPERIHFYSGRNATYFDNTPKRAPSSVLEAGDLQALEGIGVTHACRLYAVRESEQVEGFFGKIEQEYPILFEIPQGKCWRIR